MRWQLTVFDDLDRHDLYRVLALRQRVFVVEQACAYLDADGRDADAWHLLGWEQGELVAYARILPADAAHDVAIGRVVTSPERRGEGLGRALMERAMLAVAEVHGPVPIFVSAQAHLRRFYESLGFEVSGEGYDEDGIPHLPMVRAAVTSPS